MKKEFNITEWILKERNKETGPAPYMYSPVGFSCAVCKFYSMEDGKHYCASKDYAKYKGTNELTDDDGNQIKDPTKWCSNWFLPKEKDESSI